MLLEVSSLVVDFGRRRVLDGISLSADPGTSLAIMGPSGSGKTTLGFCVAGALRPTSGTVVIDGLDPRRGAEVAHIQQTTNALGRRSCRENVALGSLARGSVGADARLDADAALQRVGLDHLARQRANSLSGGELQRVAIARALVMEARVIVADEPTGQLDAATSGPVVEMLLNVANDTGTIVVLVTHDLSSATKCDRVLQLINGELVDASL